MGVVKKAFQAVGLAKRRLALRQLRFQHSNLSGGLRLNLKTSRLDKMMMLRHLLKVSVDSFVL
ncbi:hypothetical protein SEEE4220_06130 [Salmonella enterica subsp. enterica serovar Enteritidis str. 543463 42-20]|nr:hypothetical protein SEEE4220_06130 [Salmonella enterica subsp. enterica serovar Enteritidis str. 543463 42-20]